jgi:hypothetical protein
MTRAIDQWTTTASLALLLAALVACKKKTEAPAPEATATTVATVSAAASAPVAVASVAATPPPVAVDAGVAAVAAPELGAVKRFPDKEKLATGAVKVTLDDSKVYDAPDNTTPSVASLSKDLFVVRLATLGTDWILVDFPSGVGKLSPGWIEAKSVGAQVQTITKAAVAAQSATATPTAPSGKPATTAAASAKPATSAAPATTAALVPPQPTPVAPASARPKPGAILTRPHK